jgi:hypothetical protein
MNEIKPDNQPDSAKTPDQEREEALRDFMHPENKPPRPPKKRWISRYFGLVLVVLILVAGGTGYGIYKYNKSNEPVPIPATFDVSAMNSTIGPEDSVQMTFSEYSAIAPELWNEESKTLTIPIPILFKDNRTPDLPVIKYKQPGDINPSTIGIMGVEQGDTIFSPFDGEMEIDYGMENLAVFYLHTTDHGRDVTIWIAAPGGFSPLINLDNYSRKGPQSIYFPVKKNQPLCNIGTSDHVSLLGAVVSGQTPAENFNLAVTPEGKAVILKQ